MTYASGQWRVQANVDLQGEHVELAGAGAQLQQFTSTAAVEAQPTAQGWSLNGDLTFAAPMAAIAGIQLEQISGKTPLRFSAPAPGQWRGAVDVSLQSRAVSAANALELQTLAVQLPLDISVAPRGWAAEGAASLQAASLRLGGANPVVLKQAQSRLPLRLTSGDVQSRDWRFQAKSVRLQAGGAPVSTPLEARGDISVDLQQRRIEAANLELQAAALGRVSGGGVWPWESANARDVQLAIAPTSLEAIWPYLAARLPAPYSTWTVTGQSQIDLQIPRLAWRAGRRPSATLRRQMAFQ